MSARIFGVRILAVSIAVVLTLLAALLWFGAQWSRHELELAAQRQSVERESAADLAVAALARTLADFEESPDPRLLPADSVLLTAENGVWRAQPADHLAYLPETPATAPSPLFADADRAEWSAHPARSLQLIAPLRDDPRLPIRAAARLRAARLFRQSGDLPAALAAYDQLAALGAEPVEGMSAEAVARQARLAIFEQLRRPAEARVEATALAAGLASSRWPLNEAQFGFYLDEAGRVLGAPPAIEAPRLRLSAELARAWPTRDAPDRHRFIHQSLFLRLRSNPNPAYAILGPQWLEQAWRAPLAANLAPRGIALALSSPAGDPVLPNPATSAPSTTRFASATRLPWDVHAVTLNPEAALTDARLRRRLMWTALSLLTLLVLAGGALLLRALHRELTISRLQSDFVAAVSHEFRTPLTSLCQISEILVENRIADPADRPVYYGILARESRRLRRLVEGLLDFGRMEAGAREYRFETLDLAALARDVAAEFTTENPGPAARMELDCDVSSAPVAADRTALACCIWNLLDNAAKYAGEDSPIRLSTRANTLTVEDNGPGIPAEEQPRIFDKFVRGHAARATGLRGSGLGLAIVKRIVDAHRGSIRLRSAPGRGCAFTIELPEVQNG